MLIKFFKIFLRLDFYLKALIFTIPLSAALLIYLLSIGAGDFIFSDWFITLVSIPSFIANQLATPAYFGGIVDIVINSVKKTKPTKYKELTGTLLGLLLGISLGATLSALHFSVPLFSSLSAFAYVLFSFRQINIFAGLGNRLGRCADSNSRPVSEKAIILTTATIGVTLGIILFATCSAAAISVVGITSFFSGGAAIPVWIAGIIFILSLASSLASSADYTAKGFNFIRTQLGCADSEVCKTVEQRRFEYGGSCFGVTLGLIIGAIALTALIVSNPFTLTGVTGAIAGLLILTTAAGIIGSIFSRAGRLIDGFKKNMLTVNNEESIIRPSRAQQQNNDSVSKKKITLMLPKHQIYFFGRKEQESRINTSQSNIKQTHRYSNSFR